MNPTMKILRAALLASFAGAAAAGATATGTATGAATARSDAKSTLVPAVAPEPSNGRDRIGRDSTGQISTGQASSGPIVRRVDAAIMRVPRAARPHTAVIAIDRARLERLAREGGGLLDMPLGNTRVATLALRPSESFTGESRIDAMRPGADGALVAAPVEVRGAFLAGSIVDEPGTHAFLAVSDAGTYGYVETADRTYIISSGPFGAGLPTVSYDLTSLPPGLIETPAWTCGTAEPDEAPSAPGDGGVAGVQPCRQVRVAFETDFEFLQLFGGSTTAATGYISTLASALTAIYTRDVNVRIASVYARLWTTAADPWTAANTSTQLEEFEAYWAFNMSSIARDTAHFLSGRGLGGGIAYLPGLCNGSPFGVSANLGGFFPTPLADNNGQNWDIYVVAHELGHNFGAPHTHSYAPPLDGCGSSPQDCTAANQDAGTIMSYCHLCAGGVQNIKLQFHPGNIATIEQHLSGVGCNYTGPGRPPVAFLDRIAVAATVPTLVDVLANEIEFNCESVAIEFPQTVTANGGELSVSVGTGAGGRDQVRYRMPNAAFAGTDTFAYRLRDASGQTAIAAVVPTVTPVRTPENPVGAVPQLDAAYYALPVLSALPDFGPLVPISTTAVGQVDFPSTGGNFATSGRADDVGAVYSGWIEIPTGGVWSFFTNSDDGSRLRIGTTTVVNNDGLHGMVEATGSIALAAGRHAIRIEFFERGGGAGLIASWAGPGVAKAVIPPSAFWRGGVDSAADLDNSGTVDAVDLAILLGAWGTTGASADIDRNGEVGASDLALLLNAWSE